MGDIQLWGSEGQDSEGTWVCICAVQSILLLFVSLHLSLFSREIVTCAWHPKGQLFASADRNKKVILWKR